MEYDFPGKLPSEIARTPIEYFDIELVLAALIQEVA